ncbi:SDR family NAD(P)-dependent oxidoreductase [Microbispora sp. NEAU-D428]|uniref:type I polyketide synthase n=1 Tax=Microbispora sitophila TaxID=2771537 RepID=UPI001867EB30|nr:type I polyketide synthase [Microbispora sitophila]MBE3014058.1 SDR family NAD(P)-dependent oxidoreductase [Microbispora sitophila]
MLEGFGRVGDLLDVGDGMGVDVLADLGAVAGAATVLAPVGASPSGSGPSAGPVEEAHARTAAVLSLVRRWLADPAPDGALLTVVVDGRDLSSAAIRGLVRTAAAEHPGRFSLAVVDGPAPVALLAAGHGEREVSVRDGMVLVPRLVPQDLGPAGPAVAEKAVAEAAAPGVDGTAGADPDNGASGADGPAPGGGRDASDEVDADPGTVLITGGTGTLGALVARRLAGSARPPHLLLVSRSGPDTPGADALARDLRAAGAEVTVAACDVTDRDALAELLAAVPAGRPLRGVVHTAGVLADATLTELTPDALAAVLRPKVDAAWHLHELTAGLPLDRFVLFSSAVAAFGAPGQANYAAANAFLDALAEHRTGLGLPATSIAWGVWDEASAMTGGLDAAGLARLARYGVGTLATTTALDAFDRACEPYVVVSPLDDAVLREEAAAGRLPALFSRLVAFPRNARRTAGGAWASRVRAERPQERVHLVTRLVREQAAAVLGHANPAEVPGDRPLKELGFDSLTAVELRNRLNTLTGLTLPATVVFEFPTVTALAGHLLGLLTAEDPGTSSVAAVRAADDDPVVIVGMGCRFPGGVASPEDLWDLVANGIDATGDFPDDRGWDLDRLYHPDPDHRGTAYTRRGGFLYDAGEFDAAFFGMSPREALATDPQQRLLLQVSWEALERAGIDPLSLKESDTGVFVGATASDYTPRLHEGGGGADGYLLTGGSVSVASGRIAYVLGLRGPALTVDTACSSSLVALDLAVRAVRSGECSLALAGGVAVMASPGMFVEFSRQRGLSVDGRCRAFSASADGTGWAEGAGVVVVERLSRARALGHRVLAVVAGSAVNQDGASNGLTAPNGRAQEQVIGRALAEAGLGPGDVDVVEAHGTGTRLGDPIEAQALIAAYGRDRRVPLWVGSLKSNIGHAQAAAGVGGVIKMVMALRHRQLPATLHVDEPSPHVDWDGSGVALLTRPVQWAWPGRPRRAAVSSFGISGTNAHLILQQPPTDTPETSTSTPETDTPETSTPGTGKGTRHVAATTDTAGHPGTPETDTPGTDTGAHEAAGPEAGDTATEVPGRAGASRGGGLPFVLSAKTETALRAQAGLVHDVLAAGSAAPRDVAFTLTRRPRLEHRAVVDTGPAADPAQALAALRDGARHPGVITGRAVPDQRLAFLFSGQGAQRAGMGAGLLETSTVYAAAFDEISALLEPHIGVALRDLLADPERLGQTRYAQPALFAVEVALHRLAASYGLRPDFLIGHSVGELAAAHVAGVLDLASACALVAARGRLMQSAREGGAMTAFAATPQEAAELAASAGGGVEIAAINGPASVVLSGDADEVDRLAARWKAAGRKATRLKVSHAFHSAHMDGVLEEFRQVVAGLTFGPAQMPVVSTATGKLAGEREMSSPDYWVAQMRGAVRFADAVRTAREAGVTRFAELGPDGSLAALAQETGGPETDDAGTAGAETDGAGTVGAGTAGVGTVGTGIAGAVLAVPLLRPGRSDEEAFRAALARLHVAGVPVEFGPLVEGGRLTDLPTYPFETRRYWLLPPADDDRPSAYGLDTSPHPLLAGATELPDGGRLFTGVLSTRRQPWLAHHRVGGRVLVPAMALVELALAVGATAGRPTLGEFVIHAPIELRGTGEVRLQVAVSASGDLTVRSRAAEPSEWTVNATATLTEKQVLPGRPVASGPGTRLDAGTPEDTYRLLADHGYEYGPAFQGLVAAWRDEGDLYAEVALPPSLRAEAAGYAAHPALLDAALHVLSLDGLDGPRRVPYALSGVRTHPASQARTLPESEARANVASGAARARPSRTLPTRVRARLTPLDPDAYRVDLIGDDGREVLTVERLRLRPLPAAAALYGLSWEAAPPPAPVADFALVTELPENPPPLVLLDGLDRSDDPYAALDAAREVLQRWLADPAAGDARLVVLTRGLAVDGAEDARPSTTALWGLVRSARAEHPGRFALLDIGRGEAGPVAAGLEDAVREDAGPGDLDPGLLAAVGAAFPEAAIRRGAPLVPRLVAEPAAPASGTPPLWPRSAAGGTVLVTGGLGALGRRIAAHLVTRHGVRNLLLVSRRGEHHPDAAAIQAELTALGAAVAVRSCDPADPQALAALLGGLDGPLTGVVHAAGVAEDAVIEGLTAPALRRVLDAKLAAARALDEATRDADLDAFVLFGSVAGVLGTAGQGAYAAANAGLEAVVRRRRRAGRPGLTVHWGLWDVGDGMSGGLAGRDVARLGRAGIRPMAPADGLGLFDRALRLDAPVVVAGSLDLPAALRRIRPTAARVAAPDARPGGPDSARPDGPDTARAVLDAVAAVLGHDGGSEIDPERAFTDLGFDSLTAVELRNRLGDDLGVRLPAAVVFDHPTPAALIAHLDGLLAGPDTRGDQAEGPREPYGPDDDAVAIVGMACRFPGGVRTPAELWELLASGADAITEFPADRGWDPDLFDPDPDHPGTSITRYGGFLHDAAEFDPEFFGIGHREALAVDPQQRLLLQTAWEAVEDAGIDPATLRGSQSGVFVGVMYSDYGARVHQRRGAARDLEGYLVSGSAGSVASGRISYTLGLEGPAVTVDTACSSSLVAVHQAAQALRLGECALALAGGATVMASPATFIEFSRQRGLAPDGRCKPFSADADGTAWGEGVGLLVLERLSDARRNGHRVLALVRGSAVNQDGASNGLTAPNGPAQERVIRAALRGAGLRPSDVDVLEAHGTGTRLGDPIEAGAVLGTYGRDRDGRAPLLMGSVKSNIGHTQAAAGVAGIIKMVLAMRHGRVPATLHLARPSEHVDWSGGAVAVPAEPVPWPGTPGPRRAAVSSFGISGTNAHVILEMGDEPRASGDAPDGEPPETRVVPWVLSARTDEALREQAARLRRHVLADPGLRIADVALSLATTRTAFDRRAVVLGRDRAELIAGLDHLVAGTRPPAEGFPVVVTGTAVRGRTAVLFAGQGGQRTGMGAELYRRFPAYARAFDEVCAELRRIDGVDVAAVIAGEGEPGLIDRTRYTQASLFALEVALFRLLESWGLPADALAGHSVGEVAAAHVAGALTLPDAAALVAARGRLMQELPEGGSMVAVQADRATVERVAREAETPVDVAAVNAPGSVVISGDAEPVERLAAILSERGHRVKRLTVSHAFHSARMEPMLAPFRAEIADLAASAPHRTLVSTLTAEEAGAGTLGSPDHWADQVRGTVRFADAVARLRGLGAARFLEIGPDAALTAMVRQCDLGEDAVAAAALGRGTGEVTALYTFVAHAFVAGVAWDWRALLGGGAVVPLPTYPFRRERLWLAAPAAGATATGVGADDPGHPLLMAAVTVPDGGQTVYTGVLSVGRQPWLADHALAGIPVLPAAALLDVTAWLAARHGAAGVRELELRSPVPIPAEGEVHLRITVDGARVRVHGRPSGAGEWTLHAEAVLGDDDPGPGWSGRRPPEAASVDVTGAYAEFATHGYEYGPAFQGLRALWRTENELYAEVESEIVPGLLDAALHPWITGAGEHREGRIPVPYAFRGVRLHAEPLGRLLVRIRHTGEETFALDAADAGGAPVLSVAEVRVRPVEERALLSAGGAGPRPYEVVWVPAPLDGTPATGGPTVVLAPEGLIADAPYPVVTYSTGAYGDAGNPGGGPEGRAASPDGPGAAVRAALDAARAAILGLPDDGHLVVVTRGATGDEGPPAREPEGSGRPTDAGAPGLRAPGLAGPGAGGPGDFTGLIGAALWGLVRAAVQEFPGRVGVVDLDGSPESPAELPHALAARPGQLALRRGEAVRPRLRALTGAPGDAPDLGSGTVLVTGAGGALGGEVVRHLAAHHGARRLLLVSRRGDADPGLRALAAELAARDGAEVRTAACDVADPVAAEALVAGVAGDLVAVVHAAGALDDAVLENTTPDRLDRVLRPKVDAAWNLHRLTAHLPLRAFVLFSSVAGVLGNAGQAGYAAANAFLDALARHRRAAGLPGLSLAWGLWDSGAGMAAELSAAARARLDRMGIRPLDTEEALGLLDHALAAGPAVLVPARFDRAALARRHGELPEVLADLALSAPSAPSAPAGRAVPLARRLDGLDEEAARALVRGVVASRVAEVLGLPGGARVPEDRGLFDLGLDSLTAIELRNRLGEEAGERLPATVLFDHPTVRELTAYLLDRVHGERPVFDPAALDVWVSAASGLTGGDRQRAELVRALRGALSVLDPAGGRQAAGGGDSMAGVEAASDDELFGLLDRELSE